ncbi:MAG: prepilin-type N-terminal cleavage/methylation domain-containing protein [Patescibacteria group bacterium]
MNLAPSGIRQGHLRGFTLIELLVVIAIIGILSSVVLASLNTARNKGADAAVKSNLSSARAEAEIFYDSNNNRYSTTVTAPTMTGTGGTGVCAATGANVIGDSVNAALGASGSSATLATSCYANSERWAAMVALKTTTAEIYCVDSTGYASSTNPGPAISADANCDSDSTY